MFNKMIIYKLIFLIWVCASSIRASSPRSLVIIVYSFISFFCCCSEMHNHAQLLMQFSTAILFACIRFHPLLWSISCIYIIRYGISLLLCFRSIHCIFIRFDLKILCVRPWISHHTPVLVHWVYPDNLAIINFNHVQFIAQLN